MHADILAAVGIDPQVVLATPRRPRDPAFRERVLRAYGYRCAICELDIRMGGTVIGVEAAHIKWHNAGGPDIEPNGLALCSLHHKLLDRGVFTLSPDGLIVVSEQAVGSGGFDRWVLCFHGKPAKKPVRSEYQPAPEFLQWHAREVFRHPGREQVQ